MNTLSIAETRFDKRARHFGKKVSKPLQQSQHHTLPPYGQPHLPHWAYSAVNLTTTPPADIYTSPVPHYVAPNQMSMQTYVPIVQQHAWASTTNLPAAGPLPTYSDPRPALTEEKNVRDVVGERLSQVISMIDEESYTDIGKEIAIVIPEASSPPPYSGAKDHNVTTERSLSPYLRPETASPPTQSNRNVNVLTKLSYYSNSRLPASLPPLRVYISTYPLLCLAALCSANAYKYRQSAVKNEQLISANARIGTKALVVKSVTCANEKTLVFAIRGTSVLSLRDWNTNLTTHPESPAGFLDDEGNYCHSGFLKVAQAMVKPIAARLRHLLEENPSRMSYSLLFTGHSAGGAVASLLYTHMLSEQVKSELTNLADCFKRIHCVTFGAPPISLLPLQKPPGKEHKLQKSLFYSIINEGDPVVRAEKKYVLSLVDLLTTTPASAASLVTDSTYATTNAKPSAFTQNSCSLLKITNLGICSGPKKPKQQKHSVPPSRPRTQPKPASRPTWDVPPGTLSNAGRLIVLRGPEPPPKASASQVDLSKEFEEVRAFTVSDDELRKVIFGDPLMHAMDVYRRRIEALAMKAVTGRDRFY